MPAQSVLDTKKLLSAMTQVPKSTSKLAKILGVSRATLGRFMALLVEEGLAVQSGSGPTTAYRLMSPEELAGALNPPEPAETKVFMEMRPATARIVQQALELYARIGIGQFEEIIEIGRSGRFKRRNGDEITHVQLEASSSCVEALKASLLDMPANASFGILSPNVHPEFQCAFSLAKALRHRNAWDAGAPEDRLGVWHDEPLSWDRVEGLEVHSGPAKLRTVDLSQVPEGMLLQFKDGKYRVVGPTVDGLSFKLYAESVSWQTALVKARRAAQALLPSVPAAAF